MNPLPATEANNPASAGIDQLDTHAMLALINDEDHRVAQAVREQLAPIALAVDGISERVRAGGRLIYTGAGTSGRLGVLDASEMPPTFSVPPGVVVGIIAGGPRALTSPMEGAEDDPEQGARDLDAIQISAADALIGLAASGRTPYVIGALSHARRIGALTVSVACSYPAGVHDAAEINIAPLVGPEVITGSTRMKAGTAQKLVLNMISTGVMIKLGKTFGNLMVDLMATNVKLRERACRIVAQAAGVTIDQAQRLLDECNGEVKTAIVVSRTGAPADVARARLAVAHGVVRAALQA